jgi:hypothetical protein
MKSSYHPVVDLITTATDKRFEPVARMADAIICMTLQQGDCLPKNLLSEGFAQQEITTFWHFAYALAAIELRQMEGNVFSIPLREVHYA